MGKRAPEMRQMFDLGVPQTETDQDKELSFQPQIITHLLKNFNSPLSWRSGDDQVKCNGETIRAMKKSLQSELIVDAGNNTSPLNVDFAWL